MSRRRYADYSISSLAHFPARFTFGAATCHWREAPPKHRPIFAISGEGKRVVNPVLDLPAFGTSRAAPRANSGRIYVPRSVVAHSIDCPELAAARTVPAGSHDVASRPPLRRIPRFRNTASRDMRLSHTTTRAPRAFTSPIVARRCATADVSEDYSGWKFAGVITGERYDRMSPLQRVAAGDARSPWIDHGRLGYLSRSLAKRPRAKLRLTPADRSRVENAHLHAVPS